MMYVRTREDQHKIRHFLQQEVQEIIVPPVLAVKARGAKAEEPAITARMTTPESFIVSLEISCSE